METSAGFRAGDIPEETHEEEVVVYTGKEDGSADGGGGKPDWYGHFNVVDIAGAEEALLSRGCRT